MPRAISECWDLPGVLPSMSGNIPISSINFEIPGSSITGELQTSDTAQSQQAHDRFVFSESCQHANERAEVMVCQIRFGDRVATCVETEGPVFRITPHGRCLGSLHSLHHTSDHGKSYVEFHAHCRASLFGCGLPSSSLCHGVVRDTTCGRRNHVRSRQ